VEAQGRERQRVGRVVGEIQEVERRCFAKVDVESLLPQPASKINRLAPTR
jgi:hypothetical protein